MATFADALTRLQRSVLVELVDGPPFFLSGGAALAGVYLGHRQSHDLDLFVAHSGEVAALASQLERVARGKGWEIESLQSYPGFRRYRVRGEDESTLIDLVHETAAQVVKLADKPVHEGVRVDALDDLVANKLCAILGRAEVKDLVDLFFLDASGVDVLSALEQARPLRERKPRIPDESSSRGRWRKASAAPQDGGLDPATLGYVLQAMPTDPSSLLLIREVDAATLAAFRDRLVARLLHTAWPQAQEP